MKLKFISIAHHRNGICGAPFDVVLFKDTGEGGSRKVAILFEPESCCAVLDVDKLAAGDIDFRSNSWRGDVYEPSLRDAITRQHGACAQHEIDVHQLLAKRRQVAVVWSIEDVQGVRPDLDSDQAWQVLQECRRRHDCEWGFTWTFIEDIADEMFPKPSNLKE